jgi:23S rRNA G2445 N2-methylase RlmL
MHKKTKPIDTEKLLCNIPYEHNLPKQRSLLRKLYKRLAKILYREFHMEVKLAAHPVKSNPASIKEDERTLLTNECVSLIRTLKTCIELHNLHASQPQEE